MEAALANGQSRTAGVNPMVSAGCQVYWPAPFEVCGAIRTKYNALGGPNSFLLYPKSNELTNPGNSGKRTEFLGGNIYWSNATGARPVAHDFLTKYGEKGYESGFLKYPTTDEIVLPDNPLNRRQEFQGGSIYFAAGIGAHSINGLIRDRWIALGAQTGYLGYPVSDEIVTPDGAGRYSKFQHGSIYWSPSAGAHAVSGGVMTAWANAGYEGGQYGYPTGDQSSPDNGVTMSQQFQHGLISAPGPKIVQLSEYMPGAVPQTVLADAIRAATDGNLESAVADALLEVRKLASDDTCSASDKEPIYSATAPVTSSGQRHPLMVWLMGTTESTSAVTKPCRRWIPPVASNWYWRTTQTTLSAGRGSTLLCRSTPTQMSVTEQQDGPGPESAAATTTTSLSTVAIGKPGKQERTIAHSSYGERT